MESENRRGGVEVTNGPLVAVNGCALEAERKRREAGGINDFSPRPPARLRVECYIHKQLSAPS